MADKETSQLTPERAGLLIQLLRGLDNGMPKAMRPMWERMTPDFQAQMAREQAQQAQMAQQLKAGGAEPDAADATAELAQYRRTRR